MQRALYKRREVGNCVGNVLGNLSELYFEPLRSIELHKEKTVYVGTTLDNPNKIN